MNDNKSVRKKYDELMFPNYAPMEVIPDRGMGSQVWDIEGNEYLDFSGGIAVTAIGHGDLKIVKTLEKQAAKLWHVSNYYTNEPVLELAQKLVENTFAEKVLFANSGSEANEAALKLARKFAFEKFGQKKHEIVAANNSFHGRSLFMISVGGQAKYREGFGPLPTGIHHADFNDLEGFRAKINKNTCAVIIEPVQGEGGVIEADPDFLKGLRKLCDENEALLIFDEVQCGNARTGKLYAYMHYGVVPDILTTAKALGGGFPIAAVLASKTVSEALKTGTHGSTLAGNPLACAVAAAVFDEINQVELLNGVSEKREQILNRVAEINEKYPIFEKFTGLGLLIGLRLNQDFKDKAADFVKIALKEKLMLLTAGPNVVRLAPALNISHSEIGEGLCYLELAMKKFFRTKKK